MYFAGEYRMSNHPLIQPPLSICCMLSKEPANLTNSSTGKYRTDDTHLIIHSTNIHLSIVLDKLRDLETKRAGFEP